MLMIPLWQAAASTVLVVQKTDGTTETFLLSEQPVITFGASNFDVATAAASLSIPLSDVEDFHFADEGTTAIASTPSASGDTRVELLGGNAVRISGEGSKSVAVYDLSGKAAPAQISTTGDAATVSLGNMPNGIYIIKYGNNSIKVSKK